MLPGSRPLVIEVDDPSYAGGKTLGDIEYETFIVGGDPEYDWHLPADEWDAIALNYTSGIRFFIRIRKHHCHTL